MCIKNHTQEILFDKNSLAKYAGLPMYRHRLDFLLPADQKLVNPNVLSQTRPFIFHNDLVDYSRVREPAMCEIDVDSFDVMIGRKLQKLCEYTGDLNGISVAGLDSILLNRISEGSSSQDGCLMNPEGISNSLGIRPIYETPLLLSSISGAPLVSTNQFMNPFRSEVPNADQLCATNHVAVGEMMNLLPSLGSRDLHNSYNSYSSHSRLPFEQMPFSTFMGHLNHHNNHSNSSIPNKKQRKIRPATDTESPSVTKNSANHQRKELNYCRFCLWPISENHIRVPGGGRGGANRICKFQRKVVGCEDKILVEVVEE
jgi:hypothetical protein